VDYRGAGLPEPFGEKARKVYAHAQRRVCELEDAFGDLVERQRGGSSGGGSTLTERGREVLGEFERLSAECEGVAESPISVLDGEVVSRDGRLGEVETGAGKVKAIVPRGTKEVEVSVRADSVTLMSPDDSPGADGTSARNQVRGTVRGISEQVEGVISVDIDVGAEELVEALVTPSSVEKLQLAPGTDVVASFKATATRAVPRAE